MLAMVALAVDLGMLLGRKTESQRTADAAALAGAASFITAPTDADRPRDWAKQYGAHNNVDQAPADVRDEDVDVLVAEQKVRVRVRNMAARSNAVATIFGKVLGFNEMDVSTVAAAQVSEAGYGTCPLPLVLPDRWTETDNDDIFEGPPTDYYYPYDPDPLAVQCNDLQISGCDYSGYDLSDINGNLIEIKVQSGPKEPDDPNYVASPCVEGNAWRCWFQPYAVNGGPGGGGANELRPWVLGCPDETLTIGVGDIIHVASGSGNMQSLVHQDFADLVDMYPATWNDFNPEGPCAEDANGDCVG